MNLYKIIHSFYYDLNENFLESLKKYCFIESNNKYTLEALIKDYSRQEQPTPELLNYINEVNNSSCISIMEEYHEFINYMLSIASQETPQQ